MRNLFSEDFFPGLMIGIFTAVHEGLSEKDLYLVTIVGMSIYVMLRDRGSVNEKLIKALVTTLGITAGFYAFRSIKERGVLLPHGPTHRLG